MDSAEINKILRNPEFQKLSEIGGHKVYHLEGNAYEHSLLVYEASKKRFPADPLMQKVALLHDIGKLYTGICHGPDDWEYPNHSVEGSKAEVLGKFIPKTDPDFQKIQWYIRYHIKPLFWNSPADAKKLVNLGMPDGCSVKNLAGLVLCDLEGSYCVQDPKIQEDQKRKTELLNKIFNGK